MSLTPALEDLVGSQSTIKQLQSHIHFFSRNPDKFGKLALVCGGIGVGKSAVVRAVCRSVDQLYSEVLDCTNLCTEKISSVRSILTDSVRRCHGNFPSVLILENLHLICPPSSDDDASVRPQQLANAFVSLMRSARLVIIATAPNPDAVNGEKKSFLPFLFYYDLTKRDTGVLRHPFVCGTSSVLQGPSRDERRELARMLLRSRDVADEMLQLVADTTEGFAAGDLRQMLMRISRGPVTADSVAEAKILTSPSSLAGIKLHRSTLRFCQIGGLEDAKQILQETFGYPKLHAQLLSKSPIKLPTGALLYGPPGSGKTMLASAAPQEFGLNAICVSGPELLSKYIGQSEQSVRELFQRAKQCKPSLIVFDEFDRLGGRKKKSLFGSSQQEKTAWLQSVAMTLLV